LKTIKDFLEERHQILEIEKCLLDLGQEGFDAL
jgi:hypothetical protein